MEGQEKQVPLWLQAQAERTQWQFPVELERRPEKLAAPRLDLDLAQLPL